jgi:integrase/recombinase XerD
MQRKNIPSPTKAADIEVEVDYNAIPSLPNTEELYRVFSQSIFGTDFEPAKVKVKRGQPNPNKITMFQVQREFLLEQSGRNNSLDTIKSYQKNFNRIFDFLGFQWLKQGKGAITEVLTNPEKYGTAREIGAAMPVVCFELEGFTAYYKDYLERIKLLKTQSVISALRHYRAIAYFCQSKNYIKRQDITIHGEEPEIKPVFTKYELDKLKKKPRKEDYVAYRTWVMIQYLTATGNRISSVLELNVGHIDFEGGTITVNRQKNRKPKLMPLTYDIRKVLNEFIYHYRSDENGMPLLKEPLFVERTGNDRLSYEGARTAFKAYFEERGVNWEGFHKFRYSYAAHWIKDGGNPFMLKEQLGHSSLTMTNRYASIFGMATKEEAEEHSLINKMGTKSGRKAMKMRK